MDKAEQQSAGTILCMLKDGDAYVLLMTQNSDRYKRMEKTPVVDIGAKGNIESGENEEIAAMRETEEETGITPKFEKDFKEVTTYYYDDILWKTGKMTHIHKTVTYFLSFISPDDIKKIKMSHEHLDYKLVKIDDAIKETTKEGQKSILKKVKSYVEKKL